MTVYSLPSTPGLKYPDAGRTVLYNKGIVAPLQAMKAYSGSSGIRVTPLILKLSTRWM
jgi:hypothetical protein